MSFNRFRLPGKSVEPSQKAVQNRIKKHHPPFIKGPIPIDWMKRALRSNQSASRVAVALWYIRGLKGLMEFDFQTQFIMKKFDLPRNSLQRGLKTLEHLGLIERRPQKGKKTFVKILVLDSSLEGKAPEL